MNGIYKLIVSLRAAIAQKRKIASVGVAALDEATGNGVAFRKRRRKEKRHESCFNQHPPKVVREDHKR